MKTNTSAPNYKGSRFPAEIISWRAVDQDGNVLDILVQNRRNKKAAKRFFRKLLKGLKYAARVISTEKLKSYGAAKREILPGVEHRQHKRLGHPSRELAATHATAREEHAPLQKSARHAQRFLSADRADL